MLTAALDWLGRNHEEIVRGLAELVAIQSISTDGEHEPEIVRTASLTCDQMRQAGLHNVEVLKVGNSLPYAYGEWLEAAGQADTLPLCPPRRSARQLPRTVGVRPVETDPPRRPALRPRFGRRQGRHLRLPRGHRRVPQNEQSTALQHQDGRRGRGRNRLEEPHEVLRRLPRQDQIGRDRRLRHREHRSRPAVHHLFPARHRGRAGRGHVRARCPSTAAWPAGRCRTRHSP